jgi:hypothetical protein
MCWQVVDVIIVVIVLHGLLMLFSAVRSAIRKAPVFGGVQSASLATFHKLSWEGDKM